MLSPSAASSPLTTRFVPWLLQHASKIIRSKTKRSVGFPLERLEALDRAWNASQNACKIEQKEVVRFKAWPYKKREKLEGPR
jgi:hypothetical protein